MSGLAHAARPLARYSVLIVLVLIAAACDPIPASYQRVGAAIAEDGRGLQILYAACPSERVHAVRLEDVGNEQGSEDNTVLWRISSVDGAEPGAIAYMVGVAPDGFVEDVIFSGDIGPERGLIAVVETDANYPSVEFSLEDLGGGRVATNEGGDTATVDLETYLARAEESCTR